MSRLIDADEAITRIDAKLNEIPTFTESEYGIMGYRNACVAFKRMLDSLPTVNEWIPVEEDLPDFCQAVLVTCDGLIKDSVVVAMATYRDKTFFNYDGREITKVYAWMPLPRAYEVRQDEHRNDSIHRGI